MKSLRLVACAVLLAVIVLGHFATAYALPTLSFTSLTPSTITTSESTFDVELTAIGTNFYNVTQVTFSWSGPDSGTRTWYKGSSVWNERVKVNSDTSMTLKPRVLYNVSGQSKTWTWTVTLRDNTGATASNQFTVTYNGTQGKTPSAPVTSGNIVWREVPPFTNGVSTVSYSPWPMFGHDPYHTGQSQYTGPQTIENIRWSYDLGFNINKGYGGTSLQPVVGSGEIIYFGIGETQYATKAPWGKLYAFNSTGTLRWESFDFGSPVFNTPAIAPDGTIYVPTYDKGVYALNPDGTEKWRLYEEDMQLPSSILIGSNGVIYFTAGQKLYSVNPDGSTNWIYCCGPRGGSVRGGPAIGPSGDIYVVWTGFITATDGQRGVLHAYSPDGTLKWSVDLDWGYTRVTAPSVGQDGTIYFAEGHYLGDGWRLRAVNQNGEQMWQTPTVGPGYPQGSPVIDANGNIVVAANWTQVCGRDIFGNIWCFASGLWAFSPDGGVLWTIGPHGGELSNNTRFTQPIVDSQGTVFIAEHISHGGETTVRPVRLYSITPEGEIKQTIDIPAAWSVSSSPVIGAEGQMYAVMPDQEEEVLCKMKVYAFGPEVVPSDITPPAAVTDLSVTETTADSVTLTWTAPGDDGNAGTATTYDIRYSTSPITEANWGSATQVTGVPSPKPAGSTETFTVTGLTPDTLCYFVLKTADEAGNWSGLSNVVSAMTAAAPDLQPQLKAPWEGTAKITQGNHGSTSHYDHGTWDNTYAIDVALPIGSGVLAPADGVVLYVDDDPSGAGGKELAIQHTGPTGKDFVTVYLHLSEILVKEGDFVTQGQVIAKSGATGNVTGPHLHFHMWRPKGSDPEWAYDSHTMPIERLVMKQVGVDSDFREYDARKGDLDDNRIRGKEFESPLRSQPPICSIELRKDGSKIDEVDVGQFFDIYVGDSTDDIGIEEVRFSSDDVQDGIPTGEWTKWFDWNTSKEDWNASNKTKKWAFTTPGEKEVWAEVEDSSGRTARSCAGIYAIDGIDTKTNVSGAVNCLKKRGISFVGRYFCSFKEKREKAIKEKEAQKISDAGMYIVSIWEETLPDEELGKKRPPATYSGYFSEDQGKKDAEAAFKYAEDIGQPCDTPVYFAVDFDALSEDDKQKILEYFGGIEEYVREHNVSYKIGVYGSYYVLDWLKEKNLATYFYQSCSPGWSRGKNEEDWPGYNIRQVPPHNQPLCGIVVDYDEASSDFGGWRLPTESAPAPQLKCVVELQKCSSEPYVEPGTPLCWPVSFVGIGESFNIYVGGSTGDIKRVRFLVDESQNGVVDPGFTWSEYDWDISSGNWNHLSKTMTWSFATGGRKEIWVEIEDSAGQTKRCAKNIVVFERLPNRISLDDVEISTIISWLTQKRATDEPWPVFLNASLKDSNIRVNILLIASKDPVTEYKLVRVKSNPVTDPRDLKLYGILPSTPLGCIENYVQRMLTEWFTNFGKKLAEKILIEIVSKIVGTAVGIEIPASAVSFLYSLIKCSAEGYAESLEGWKAGEDYLIYLPMDLPEGLELTLKPERGICNCAWATSPWIYCRDCPGQVKGMWKGRISDVTNEIFINIEETDSWWAKVFKLFSPGELRVYDSQGRVTGLVNGEVIENIPNSRYDEENHAVGIFFPTDSYVVEVVGTEKGNYGLEAVSIEEGEATFFTATDIPITAGAVHQYTIDWDALSKGEEGVTLQIDNDGDGVIDRTVTSDDTLTEEDLGVIPPGQFVNHGPNPVPAEGCVFWLNLPDDTVNATIKIFDINGALLVSIPLDPAAKRYPVTGRWLPQDNQGRLLGTGLYLYLVEIRHANGTVTYSRVQKMVIKR